MRSTCTLSVRMSGNAFVGFPNVSGSSYMPTDMPFAPMAEGAARRAAASAIAAASRARPRNARPPARRADAERPAQACLELDLGLPAEDLLRPGDVGLTLLGVVLWQSLVDDLAGRPGQAEDRLGELEDRELARVAEVHGEVLVARGEREETAHQVVDVAEAPRLRAVAEDRERLARERLAQEGRDRAPVVRAHPRPVRVEDAHDRRVDALLAVIGHREGLGVALRFVVHTARPDGVDVAPVRLRLRVHE